MKTLLNKSFYAIVTLLCTFIIGITPSMIVSLFIVITTNVTLQDCITTVPFVLFSAIGIFISVFYINESMK